MMPSNCMRLIKSITKSIVFALFVLPQSANAQSAFLSDFELEATAPDFIPIRKLSIRRSGPYVGLQQGKYMLPEFGYEMQWNKLKLRNPITQAGHMGFNYNFQRNVLGYDAGYWLKIGRMDLTYGANLVFRTDFDKNAMGLAPVVGFKFWQLHLQTGYHFLTAPARNMETNTFFVSLRFVFINDRDWNWSKKQMKD